MLNDIFYFIDEEEKNILRNSLKDNESKTFTIMKKLDSKDYFNEKFAAIKLFVFEVENIIDSFDTKEFAHLVINRPYLVSKDHF